VKFMHDHCLCAAVSRAEASRFSAAGFGLLEQFFSATRTFSDQGAKILLGSAIVTYGRTVHDELL